MTPEATAVDWADLCLAAALRSSAASLAVHPQGDAYTVALVQPGGGHATERLGRDLGHAVAARLALLAGADPWAPSPALGRLRVVGPGGASADFLVLSRAGPEGLGTELRRVVAPPTLEATVALSAATVGSPLRLGAYRLEREIGRGNMGTVFLATHEPTGRSYAVKVLHADVASDPLHAAQFVREGRAASVANGTDTVNVFDFGVLPDGRAFLVMEVLTSPTLETVLAGGPLEPRRALVLARRIAAALEGTHVRGVVHRDLKPSNVFVDAHDRVKLADFGTARVEAADPAATLRGLVVGTPLYMSPEQAQGHDADERADLYALGCILYRMLTGRLPFEAERVADLLLMKLTAPVPRAVGPAGPLPDGVQEVLSRALARRVDERFPNAAAFGSDLDRLLSRSGPGDAA